MAGHAEDALRGACIAQILDLPLAVPAPEAVGAKGLVAGQDGEVFDLVPAVVAAVGAVVADQGAVSEQQQVGVRVEQGAARVAAEAVDVPSVASELKSLALLEDLTAPLARVHYVVLVDRRLWIGSGRLHGGGSGPSGRRAVQRQPKVGQVLARRSESSSWLKGADGGEAQE